MVFNSAVFLVFFVTFFFIYWYVNNHFNIRVRNTVIVLASYLFYGWWDWRFLGLIVVSTITDFVIGILLQRKENKRVRKNLLLISLMVNLGILGVFKYFNFFIESLQYGLSIFHIAIHTKTLNIILPVGISFYTFQTLSYTIDIYKGKLKPTYDIISFSAFVSFFPQLVAGPIERAGHLLGQFQEKKIWDYNSAVGGLRLVLWGLFKKVVLADNFGKLSDLIFDLDTTYSGAAIILGVFFFAIQIYTDFSGYSDIAIGISKMLGFELMTNFRTPYFAHSFGDFWHRWHISLSTWFRDYVYIPLGGSRKSVERTHFNIFITFVLSGLWHGANVTFLIWGGIHGIVLIFEKQFNLEKFKRLYSPVVLIIIIFLWLPFRASDFDHLKLYMHSLFQFSHYNLKEIFDIITGFSIYRFLSLLIILSVFLIVEYCIKGTDFNLWIDSKSRAIKLIAYYLIVFIICFAGMFDIEPGFIYFQF